METNWFDVGQNARQQNISAREAENILLIYDDAKGIDPENFGPPLTDAEINEFWDGFYFGTKIQCGG